MERPNGQNNLEKKLSQKSILPNFKTYYKLQKSRLCGIDIKIDKEISGRAQRPQKQWLADF